MGMQSWLLRHIYDWEKVPKHAFSLLLDYLGSIQGNITRERILKDAMDMINQYKDWEKEEESGNNKSENNDENEKKKEAEKTMGNDNENNDKILDWNKLSSHDKRKQYKRARQVLQALQG